MDRVYQNDDKPFEQVRGAGIAIREIDPQQRHLGLLHWDAVRKQVVLLHLAWHFDLRCDSPRHDYLWIDPALPKRRLVQLAAALPTCVARQRQEQNSLWVRTTQ